MPNDQEQLERARALIKAKKYSEARRILEPLNHPTAQSWLAKLDEKAISPTATAKQKTTPITSKRNPIPLIIGAGIIGLVVLIVGYIALSNVATDNTARIQERLYAYCVDDRISYDDFDFSDCSAWAAQAMIDYDPKPRACHDLSPELDAPFMECLDQENLFVPLSNSFHQTSTEIFARNATLMIRLTQTAEQEYVDFLSTNAAVATQSAVESTQFWNTMTAIEVQGDMTSTAIFAESTAVMGTLYFESTRDAGTRDANHYATLTAIWSD